MFFEFWVLSFEFWVLSFEFLRNKNKNVVMIRGEGLWLDNKKEKHFTNVRVGPFGAKNEINMNTHTQREQKIYLFSDWAGER